jgi:pantoate--beta-alanine ligase
MIVFKEAERIGPYLQKLQQAGNRIGFVPTMGALHAGHLSLIKKSKSTADKTVCSIFVNPTQFNDPADYKKYPVTIANDVLLLENAGCDFLFLPTVSEIYPNGTSKFQHYDLGDLEFQLEGKFRPGHFQGVCQVVHRLLEIVGADVLFMGNKDYQQCLVIKRLVQLLHLSVQVQTVPTYREPSGLAMSSRNLRLEERQKDAAAVISKMLRYIKDRFETVPPAELEQYATDHLLSSGFDKVDYVSIADAETLRPITTVSEAQKPVALIAAFIGDVRLIDNVVLRE